MVIPVNYCYLNNLIIFRTAADSPVAQYGLAPIAFQIDFVDEGLQDGWSVLVNGMVRPTTAQETDAARDRVEPWAGGTRDSYMAIEPHRTTGPASAPGDRRPPRLHRLSCRRHLAQLRPSFARSLGYTLVECC